MANDADRKVINGGFARTNRWRGRSGQSYELVAERFDTFSLDDAQLYLLAKGAHVLWVGSTDDLVGDPHSRARFRLALDCADRIFRLANGGAEAERLSTIWDLEGGELALEAVAA
jgi:hypothetical protein